MGSTGCDGDGEASAGSAAAEEDSSVFASVIDASAAPLTAPDDDEPPHAVRHKTNGTHSAKDLPKEKEKGNENGKGRRKAEERRYFKFDMVVMALGLIGNHAMSLPIRNSSRADLATNACPSIYRVVNSDGSVDHIPAYHSYPRSSQ